MASEGPNRGSTVFSSTWTNPNNANASDDAYATYQLSESDTSDPLVKTNFGFSIPTGATIDGIEPRVEHKTDGSNVLISAGRMLKEASPVGNNISDVDVPASDDVSVLGSPTEKFGTTWTPEEINDEGFGIQLVYEENDGGETPIVSVDDISITVYYTEAGSTVPMVQCQLPGPAIGPITIVSY